MTHQMPLLHSGTQRNHKDFSSDVPSNAVLVWHQILVAQCSATPAAVAATPPCSRHLFRPKFTPKFLGGVARSKIQEISCDTCSSTRVARQGVRAIVCNYASDAFFFEKIMVVVVFGGRPWVDQGCSRGVLRNVISRVQWLSWFLRNIGSCSSWKGTGGFQIFISWFLWFSWFQCEKRTTPFLNTIATGKITDRINSSGESFGDR